MADSEQKARQKLEEAEKKSRKGGGFFGSLLGGGNNAVDACELYNQAGNLFKVAKNWSAAGDAFLKSAELHTAQADAKHDAALDYDKAGTCYRKVDAQKAVECFEKCIEFYTDMGRFNMAAKVHSTIAEIYETEAPNKEQCIKHHQIAADFYKGEEAKSSATKCLIRVAQLSAELGNYRRAIEVFEEIAVFEADHPTLKYAAKNHFFMALLCHLCIDVLDTQNALKRYEDISPSFADSREYKFVKDLTVCMEEQSVEHFTETVHGFDKISRLDPWQTSLLLMSAIVSPRCWPSV
ncbi:Aromatic-di-Alanine repeat protein [Aphelenchoides fujianensis]|nr:Aromatic-di-Alanine repeat protein [Aphelenchoides fujianensis]